jgi:hypothetical protein
MDFGVEADAKEIFELNCKLYSAEWRVPEEYVYKILEKNRYMYRILRTPEGIKGLYSFFPFSKEVYEGILSGEVEESDLFLHLLDYDKPKEVYLYLISILVDVTSPLRKTYTRELLRDFESTFSFLSARGIVVNEVGAIAVSESGVRITNSLGFKYDKTISEYGKDYPVLRTSADAIRGSIDLSRL